MEHSKPTQAQRILDHMLMHGGITPLEAMNDYGIMQLASRIAELRQDGHSITSKTVEVKNRFGEPCYVKRYSLTDSKEVPS